MRPRAAPVLPALWQWAIGVALWLLAELVLRHVYDPAGPLFGQRELELSGALSLAFLLLTLLARPLRLTAYRRGLGLAGFFYLLLHLYFGYARFLDADLGNLTFLSYAEQAGIWLGLIATLGLLPLALTSSGPAVRRLGRRWKRLHRLGPPMTLLAVAHTVWIGVHFGLWPLAWSSAALILLTIGIFVWRLGRRSHRPLRLESGDT